MGKSGLATLAVSDRFFIIERSWRSEEMYSCSLRACFFVIGMYALDREKDLNIYIYIYPYIYETFIKDVTEVLTASRSQDIPHRG